MRSKGCADFMDQGSTEAAERRREERLANPEGYVELGGESFMLKDWSSSGFLAADYSGDLKPGDRVPIRVCVFLDDAENFFDCKAYVVRVDEESREIAGAFVEMDAEDRLAISLLFG